MPNWCTNTLSIVGPEDKLHEFKERANDYGPTYNNPRPLVIGKKKEKKLLSFHAFVPVPNELQKMTYGAEYEKRSGKNKVAIEETLVDVDDWDRTDQDWGENQISSGYDWEVANWGCKWGASQVQIMYDGTNGEPLVYAFETPWGPPEAFLDRVAEMYPELEFHIEFKEEGMCFEGSSTYVGGKAIEKDSWKIDPAWKIDPDDFEEDE